MLVDSSGFAIRPIPIHDFDAMCENKAVFQSSRLRFNPTKSLGAQLRDYTGHLAFSSKHQSQFGA
jgi:hypothetical protein